MELERSRNGFYTLTFNNKNNTDKEEIMKDFNTVGHVVGIVQNFQRIFIRFKEKEEAERALKKFGKVYDVQMAKNNKPSDNHHAEGEINHNQKHPHPLLPTPDTSLIPKNMEKPSSCSKVFHLILGNLPKNYTAKDVNGLVAEAKPISISSLEETRVFNIKFCHIVLDCAENLTYLIDKLNGFVICGEKLIAAEAKNLLEWKEKAV